VKLKNKTKRGVGMLGVIFVVFLTLKLTGAGCVAAWSWWWVTAPIWAPPAAVISVGLVGTLVITLYETFKDKRR